MSNELHRREAAFRDWLKTTLFAKNCFVNNIESSTKNGIPDMYVVSDHSPFWIELKASEKKTACLIRKEQRVWGLKHQRAGGKAFVIHYIEETKTCEVYGHPIRSVQPSGNYLKILDEPLYVCPRSLLYDALLRALQE